MKKMLIVLSLFISVIMIYSFKKDNKLSCFEITDTRPLYLDKYINNYIVYNKPEYRIIDFLYDIRENRKVKNKYFINNLFVTSDLIIINIGNNDLKYSGNYGNDPLLYIDKTINKYTILLKEIRKISKEKIIIVSNFKMNKKYNDYWYNKINVLKNKFDIEVKTKKEVINYLKNFTNH